MEPPLPVGCNARVEAVRPPAVCEKHYGHCLQHSENLGKERRTSSQEGLASLMLHRVSLPSLLQCDEAKSGLPAVCGRLYGQCTASQSEKCQLCELGQLHPWQQCRAESIYEWSLNTAIPLQIYRAAARRPQLHS